MSYEKKERIAAAAILLAFLCAIAAHYTFSPWGFYAAPDPAD